MNLIIKSVILVSLCLITILAVSYGFLRFLSHDINAAATMFAKEQVNYNGSQILPAFFIALLLLSTTLTLIFNLFVVKRINRLNQHIQSFAQGDGIIFSATNSRDEINFGG